MTERIIVPTENQEGLNAKLAEHFGRAPYYTIVEIDDKNAVSNVKTVPNVGEHAGGMGFSHDHILEYKPTALIVYGMGPRGLTSFQSAGVTVLKANASTVNEVISAYKNDALPALTDGCEHAHHKDQDIEHGHYEHHH
jgi:predicted Fe-Mo cluster-binding NifX family protein